MKNLKNLLLLFSITLLFTQCKKDDDVISTQETTAEMSFNIDGKETNITDVEDGVLISGNSNCNNIYLTTVVHTPQDADIEKYELKFTLLNNGEIKSVDMVEFSRNPVGAKRYLSADFNPKSTFSITNFSYGKNSHDLSFEFSGTLYREYTRSGQDEKHISGKVSKKSLLDIECGLNFVQDLTYESSTFEFHTIIATMMKNNDDLDQSHHFMSNNGYFITLKTMGDLWDYPVGDYTFNQSSTLDRVQFKKYIGDTTASQSPIFYETDWTELATEGSFSITSKSIENSSKFVSGRINFKVFDGNQLVYEIYGMKFITGSFE